jgi:hypothetical protein
MQVYELKQNNVYSFSLDFWDGKYLDYFSGTQDDMYSNLYCYFISVNISMFVQISVKTFVGSLSTTVCVCVCVCVCLCALQYGWSNPWHAHHWTTSPAFHNTFLIP